MPPKKNIICGIIYRQHNSPERFLEYFEQTLEKFISTGKNVCVMGDFNLCLLKSEVSEFSHNFLLSLQSCYLIPTIDKPSRVPGNLASLIDNIFVNNPDCVSVSGKKKSLTNMKKTWEALNNLLNRKTKESRQVNAIKDFNNGNKINRNPQRIANSGASARAKARAWSSILKRKW